MKHPHRIFLLIAALAAGGLLGAWLLPGFRPLKILLFAAACPLLGKVFFLLDRYLSGT